MKTPAQIQEFIDAYIEKAEKQKEEKGEVSKALNKKIRTLMDLKIYAEKCQNNLFVENQIKDIEKRIKITLERYSSWTNYDDPKKSSLTHYCKIMGVNNMKQQLSNLKFLLD